MKKEENSTSIWQETHVLLELKSTADGIESNPNETIMAMPVYKLSVIKTLKIFNKTVGIAILC